MTLRLAFGWAAIVLGGLIVVMAAAIVVIKAFRERRAAREAELVRRLRPLVLAALDDPDEASRTLTAPESAVVESIALSLLTKTRGADREALAVVLDRSGILERARHRLHSRRAVVRERAVVLLGAAGDRASTTDLIGALSDHDAGVRAAAVQALGRVGDPRAIGPLLVCLADRSVSTNSVSMAILRIGPTGLDQLRAGLQSPFAPVRSVVAELLGVLGDAPARARLEELVRSDDAARVAAIGALGRIGDPSSTELLVGLLDRELGAATVRERPEVAVASATALGNIGDRRAVPVLTAALGGPYRVSFAAAAALATMDPRRPLRSSGDLPESGSIAPAVELLRGRPAEQLPVPAS